MSSNWKIQQLKIPKILAPAIFEDKEEQYFNVEISDCTISGEHVELFSFEHVVFKNVTFVDVSFEKIEFIDVVF